MSALYSSGAMGGVVNIITMTPVEKNETAISGSYGSLDTYSATLVQGGYFEKGGYLVGARLFDTDGYIQAKDPAEYYTKNARTDWSMMGKILL